MKFYKRLPIHRKDPMSDRFAVEADDRIITSTAKGMQMPRGTAAQRSIPPVNGELRYNTEIGVGGELEVYVNGVWEIVKTNRHATVTQQQFNNGDYADTLFGPLAYDIDPTKPENLNVFVENVPQIPGTNFILEQSVGGDPIQVSATVIADTQPGETVIYLNSVADFNPGNIIYGEYIVPGTTVVDSVSSSSTITISAGVTGLLAIAKVVTTVLTTGTYVKFLPSSLPVPNKPVITMLGLDGYCPPFEV